MTRPPMAHRQSPVRQAHPAEPRPRLSLTAAVIVLAVEFALVALLVVSGAGQRW